ncbi:hypothetical protein LZ554_002842 [Drepanopeziza brunnea f. sp. 'monogermtubi']|nr:hypothetical protein LZ554_002842 [Drepanopeziza brunnea f. sp. 'monogermtubi']
MISSVLKILTRFASKIGFKSRRGSREIGKNLGILQEALTEQPREDDGVVGVSEPRETWEYLKRYRQRNVEKKKFHYEVCDKTYQTSSKLKRHMNIEVHRKAALGVERQLTNKQRATKESSARVRAQKKHYCIACHQTFGAPNQLAMHLFTTKHTEKIKSLKSTAGSTPAVESDNPPS